MMHVACKDLGLESCPFVVEADKPRKVENAMLEHIRDEHPEMIAGITDTQHSALEHRIREHIVAG
ncbi:MAG: DUF1059 domain-containing protein [Actinobacteria bacterium]|nr:DUF1059 domain-containing protein [Actinomycetota bacterium]